MDRERHRSRDGGCRRECRRARGAARRAAARKASASAESRPALPGATHRRARAASRPRMTSFLFDLDGTLTDPREGITRSIAYALERLGVEPPPAEDLVFAIGPPLRASLAQLLGSEERATVEK